MDKSLENLIEQRLYIVLKDRKNYLKFKKIGLESNLNLRRNLGIKRFGLKKYYNIYHIFFY